MLTGSKLFTHSYAKHSIQQIKHTYQQFKDVGEA